MSGYDKFGLPCRLYWEQGGEGVQVVYVDVLLVVNFFMTLLLLLLTAALTKQPRRPGRLCIAAMLGAAYSLILLAPKLPTWVVVLSKIAVALVLVFAAFGFGSVKKYLRCLLCFLAANFVLLGFIVGVWLLFRPRRIVVKNSAVYFDLPARTLLLLALAAFLLTHTGLPLSAVRPMACMAAAVGAAVSAAVLACRLQKRLLLCGLGCGAFYAVCLLAATLLANGRLDWQGSNAMLPLALLLGGLLGGALTALRAGR